MEAVGSRAAHAFAFARGGDVIAVAPRLVLRLARTGGWSNTALALPPGSWHNVLDGERYDNAAPVALATLLRRFPVALLERTA